MKKFICKHRVQMDRFVNIVIVLSTSWAVLMYFIGEPDILGSHDVQCFKYFTTDSNILAAMGSLLYLICGPSHSEKLKRPVPQWVSVFKFVGTVAASITLLTVVFFLVPLGIIRSGGFGSVPLFFKGNVFVLHLSTPVLAIISTLFLETDDTITKKQALWGVAPSAVYGLVYLTMVVFLKQWNDWYGFTFGGKYQYIPMVMLVMFLFCLGISLAEWRLKKAMKSRH